MASKAAKDPKNWVKTEEQYGYYKIPGKEVAGYASIDFAMNLVFQCIALYISYFYTDIFGLKPGHVAIIFAVSRIWDAINDPLMGLIVERNNPKQGKYWIYVRWGAIPFAIAAVLTYTTPNFSYPAKLAWALVFYNVLNMLYTFIIQPYASAATVMTNDQNERTKLQSVRMTLAQAGGVVCAIMLPQLSGALSKHMSLARGYMVTTIIMAVIMLILLMWGSGQIVERIPPQVSEEKVTPKDIFYYLFRIGPIFLTFILFLGVYTMSQVQSTMGAYYITYYANAPGMLAWFSMIMMLFSVIGVPCTPAFVRKFRKKGTVMISLAIAGIGCLILYLMPQTAIVGMMVARAITGYGYGLLMGILWSVFSDPIEYADWKTGRRPAALIMTVIGLGLKFSMVIGGSVPTAVLQATGYVANQTQNATTMAAIRSLTSLLPLAAIVITMILYGLFYHLDEDKVRQMQLEIAERNAKRAQQ